MFILWFNLITRFNSEGNLCIVVNHDNCDQISALTHGLYAYRHR